MKMVKKILLGLVATAAVLALASCKMGAGEGETEGNKWDLTMTVDATAEAKNPLAEGKVFRRYWKEFSTSEKVAEITTTITINPADQVYDATKKPAFVSGLIFDLNKNADDSKKVDFNLIGVNPQTQKFYVERYVGISKQDAELYDGDSTQTDIAAANGTTATSLELASAKKSGAWCALTDKMYKVSSDGVVTCVVTISQENKKYSVKLGDVTVAEYDASTSTNTAKIKKDKAEVEYAVGGIACYGNAGKGNKLVVNYTTDKESVTGKLEAEEIEE
jgi:hypothetical protein